MSHMTRFALLCLLHFRILGVSLMTFVAMTLLLLYPHNYWYIIHIFAYLSALMNTNCSYYFNFKKCLLKGFIKCRFTLQSNKSTFRISSQELLYVEASIKCWFTLHSNKSTFRISSHELLYVEASIKCWFTLQSSKSTFRISSHELL